MSSIRLPGLGSTDGRPSGALLLDGAMGTALIAAGLPAGEPPERWVLDRPAAVADVHRAHRAAGAHLLLTCTFNAAAARFAARLSPRDALSACRRAVTLARAEADGALVAGALGPLALARPGGAAPAEEALGRPFEPALRALFEAGVDLLWLESQYDPREAAAALTAALAFGLPVVTTFTLVERDGRLQAADGGAAEPLLLAAANSGAAAVGVNCVPAGPALTALAAWARRALGVPFVARPSAGLPGAVLGPEHFADLVAPAVASGAAWIGGCCGADAAHLAALARRPGVISRSASRPPAAPTLSR